MFDITTVNALLLHSAEYTRELVLYTTLHALWCAMLKSLPLCFDTLTTLCARHVVCKWMFNPQEQVNRVSCLVVSSGNVGIRYTLPLSPGATIKHCESVVKKRLL